MAIQFASGTAEAQTIDPCLVGTWEAKGLTALTSSRKPSGGEGFTVTFAPDGTQTIDYTKMAPEEWDKGTPSHNGLTYRGTAKGRITTSNGAAKIETIETQDVTMQVWHSGGPTQEEAPFGPGGLGPGMLGSTADDNAYVCNEKELEYRTSLARDKPPAHVVKLARVGGASPTEASAPEPAISVNGKTWLTAAEIKDRQQDIRGLWRDVQPEEEELELSYFTALPSGALIDHPPGHPDSEPWSVDMQAAADREWRGKVWTCPRPKGKCTNLCRWDTGSMRIDPNNVAMSFEWHGNKSKTDCSGYEVDPASGTFERKRIVGVSFVPLAPGKYISLAGAPAVGNQAAQFTAVARIAANYPGIPNPDISATSDRGGKIVLKDKEAGIYEFTAEKSGVHELLFELRDGDGVVFHTDRMRVEVPEIPGLGR